MASKHKQDIGMIQILQNGAEILQNNVYAQKIRKELEQDAALFYFGNNALSLQGLLLVYFSILLSAFKYFSDLKQNKEFTRVQRCAFHLLRNDVREYENLLKPALKNLDEIPPFSGADLCGNHANIHKVYIPLVNLSRTYLPYLGYERGDYYGITYEEHFYPCGSRGEDPRQLDKYCKHPLQHQSQINQNKQGIMQELGKEIKDFYVVCEVGTGNSDDFFYWFGYAMNNLWRGTWNNFIHPFDIPFKVTELLMATKKMGDKYFNPEYAELYINMLEKSGFKNTNHLTRYENERYSNARDALLGNANPNIHTK